LLKSGAAAVVIAGGPGDPVLNTGSLETVKKLLGQIPLLGIGLGHSILALALGARIFKLPFGHRGGNQSVREEKTGRVLITTQNHSFCVDEAGLPADITITHRHINDNTVEGLAAPGVFAFSIQHQAEAPSGSYDLLYPFNELHEVIGRFAGECK
jgi:carbamoyl-phosphate synthase small subunit